MDEVLYESGLSKDVALKRAKAIMSIGAIFKAVEADESDEERRELERWANPHRSEFELTSPQTGYECR